MSTKYVLIDTRQIKQENKSTVWSTVIRVAAAAAVIVVSQLATTVLCLHYNSEKDIKVQ